MTELTLFLININILEQASGMLGDIFIYLFIYSVSTKQTHVNNYLQLRLKDNKVLTIISRLRVAAYTVPLLNKIY